MANSCDLWNGSGSVWLAAAITVFGPWPFWRRVLTIAAVVMLGADGLLLHERPSIEDFILFALFGLLLWGINQLPLWPCRLLLNARAVADGAISLSPARAQYGIRQLMGLTFGVALLLGVMRL